MTYKNTSAAIKKMAVRTDMLIITLNVNVLNAPTKRHWLAEWIQKHGPCVWCLQETHFKSRGTHKSKVRRRKKVFHANENSKKSGVAIFISDKIDFTDPRNFAETNAWQFVMQVNNEIPVFE